MNNNETTNPGLENALLLMEPSSVLTAQDIERLMADDGCAEEARNIWRIKKALDQTHVSVPDAGAEWERFVERVTDEKRPRARFLKLGVALLATAAIALLLFTMPWRNESTEETDKGIVAYTAKDQPRDIVITTDKGGSVVVNRQSVAELGQNLSQTDTETIAYRNLSDHVVESHTISIPQGQTFKLMLADGSDVWLNAGSRLVYPTRFTGAERLVELTGEAYFRVAHDEAHPFVVKAGGTLTRVLGTEFNVRNYNPSEVSVTLIQGRVSVGSRTQETLLTPGEQARIDGGGNCRVETVDTDRYIYWRDGYLFFDDEPLSEVMCQIGEWYNVSVVFLSKEHMSLPMHIFCNRNEPVEKTVEQLNMLQNAVFRLEDKTIYIR